MTVKLEKNIPIPAARRGRKAGIKYPLDGMEPGDSFAVKREKKHTQAYLAGYLRKLRPNWKFVTRIDQEKNEVRVWRVA